MTAGGEEPKVALGGILSEVDVKISTLVAVAGLSGLFPAAWACDYGKPTDASVAAPAQMAAVGTQVTPQAAPIATSKAPTSNAVKLACDQGSCGVKPDVASAGQRKHARPVAVACEGAACD